MPGRVRQASSTLARHRQHPNRLPSGPARATCRPETSGESCVAAEGSPAASGEPGDTQHTFLSPRRRPSPGRRRFLWLRERALEFRGASGCDARRRYSVPRWRHRCRAFAGLRSRSRSFRRLALASAVMLVVIVASGATVRLTGSGLGCQHWPGCQAGDPFPKTGYHSFIEFSNRIVAAIAILATLAAFVAALRVPRRRAGCAGSPVARSSGTLAAGAARRDHRPLQAQPVARRARTSCSRSSCSPSACSSRSRRGTSAASPCSSGIRTLALVVGAACGALLVSGVARDRRRPALRRRSVSRGSGSSSRPSGCTCARPRSSGSPSSCSSRGSDHAGAAISATPSSVLALLVVQMIVGEIQYRTHLPLGLVILHVTLSAVVWAATVVFVATLWRPSRMA